MHDEVVALRREVRALKGYVALLTAGLTGAALVAGLAAFRVPFHSPPRGAAPGGPVLHVRGLVIEDGTGRPRVLLGPTSADRLVVGYGPDPMAGGRPLPRQAEGVGVFLHDTAGNERGGYDFIAVYREAATLGSIAAAAGAPAEGFLKLADTTGATRARLAVAGVAMPTLRVWGADGRVMREVLTP